MNREKLIATLQQIKALAEEGLRAFGKQPTPRSFKSERAETRNHRPLQVDFQKPLRPFVKSYAKGLSGPKKFTLVLSWLAKGDVKKQVPLSEIKKQWNRMTAKSLLGMKFNFFFLQRLGTMIGWSQRRKVYTTSDQLGAPS